MKKNLPLLLWMILLPVILISCSSPPSNDVIVDLVKKEFERKNTPLLICQVLKIGKYNKNVKGWEVELKAQIRYAPIQKMIATIGEDESGKMKLKLLRF